jgi:hypothetical protein
MEHLEVVSTLTVTQTGTVTSGSPTVTGLTTSALAGALLVTGTGIGPATYVQTIDSPSQVTLTSPATANGSVTLTFGIAPLGVADAKKQLRLEIPDDDTLVARLINSATIRAQTLLRQTLLTTVYNQYFDQFPASANGYYNRLVRMMGPNPQWLPNGASILTLNGPPLVSVQSVQYYDPSGVLQTVDPSTYFVSTGLGCRVQPVIGHVWPVVRPQIDGVLVQYTAGYSSPSQIGDNIKAAMLLMIGHWYEHREEVGDAETYPVPMTVDSLLGASDPGIYA